MEFTSKMLKEMTTPVKWQGGNFKNTQLQFICPSSTEKMTSDCNRNRLWLKAFIKSCSLSRNVTEQRTRKHVVEIQFLFTQDFALMIHLFFFFFSFWLGFACLSKREAADYKSLRSTCG